MLKIDEARRYYDPSADPAHDFDHVLRVALMAKRIAHSEGADVEIAYVAALLHDVGRSDEEYHDHAEAAAARAREILKSHPARKVEAVAQAILQHRFRMGPVPQSLEARCVFDADKLDAIGAIGVARVFAYSGVLGRRLWAGVDADYAMRFKRNGRDSEEHTAHHEYVIKLSKLRERMMTKTGRGIAEKRHDVMVAFFAQLEKEVDGME